MTDAIRRAKEQWVKMLLHSYLNTGAGIKEFQFKITNELLTKDNRLPSDLDVGEAMFYPVRDWWIGVVRGEGLPDPEVLRRTVNGAIDIMVEFAGIYDHVTFMNDKMFQRLLGGRDVLERMLVRYGLPKLKGAMQQSIEFYHNDIFTHYYSLLKEKRLV